MTVAIAVLVALVAAANGANDVGKGVATLAGAGITHYRTAIAWGTLATFAGSLASVGLAERLTNLFSSGIVDTQPTAAFAAAVLAGVAAWVGLATLVRAPVSTTHAIVGALIGAGLVASPAAIQWRALSTKVATPLLASVGVAFMISALANAPARRRPECVCLEPAPALGFLGGVPVRVRTGTASDCQVHRPRPAPSTAWRRPSSQSAQPTPTVTAKVSPDP